MNEVKRYRIRFFRTWPAVCVLLGVTVWPWALYMLGSLLLKSPNLPLVVCWLLNALVMICFLIAVILSAMMTVTVTDDELVIARPDTQISVKWNEIKRIESSWTIYGGNFVYYIVTTEGRRLPFIPDYIDRCDELLQIIQQRSGKRIVSETRTVGITIQESWQRFARLFRKFRGHKFRT